VRRSALHDRLKAAGACFGEAAGWERPNWYAPHGEAPQYRYSYGRQNWFPFSAAEHRAVREAVGLFATNRRSPNLSSKGGTRRKFSTGSARTMSRFPSAGSSTPSGSTIRAASKPI
jgi:aminomethyltransferase folate-binding domain-containing protein